MHPVYTILAGRLDVHVVSVPSVPLGERMLPVLMGDGRMPGLFVQIERSARIVGDMEYRPMSLANLDALLDKQANSWLWVIAPHRRIVNQISRKLCRLNIRTHSPTFALFTVGAALRQISKFALIFPVTPDETNASELVFPS